MARSARERLRAMPADEAMADLRTLRGIGDFFATAILMRGAGLVDAYPDDRMTRAGIGRFYGIDEPSDDDVARITQGWKPFRMWCSVLVHASERRSRCFVPRPRPAGRATSRHGTIRHEDRRPAARGPGDLAAAQRDGVPGQRPGTASPR